MKGLGADFVGIFAKKPLGKMPSKV